MSWSNYLSLLLFQDGAKPYSCLSSGSKRYFKIRRKCDNSRTRRMLFFVYPVWCQLHVTDHNYQLSRPVYHVKHTSRKKYRNVNGMLWCNPFPHLYFAAEYSIREYYRGLSAILLRNGLSNAFFFSLRTPISLYTQVRWSLRLYLRHFICVLASLH